MNFANSKRKYGYWLGISDASNEGRWITEYGDRQTYFNWRRGEPNNAFGGREDYAYVSTDGGWNDNPPDAKHPSICTYIIQGTNP